MKFKKVLVFILLFISIFSLLQTKSLATNAIVSTMQNANTPVSGGKIGDVINIVIGLLQVAGTGIALIVITLAGVKYLLASPGEKADIKKQIIPIVIGCVLLFGAVNILVAVYDLSQNILNTN